MQIIQYSGLKLAILMCCSVTGCFYVPMPESHLQTHAHIAKVDQTIVQQLQTGKSTRVDVLLLLGAPSRSVDDDRFFIYEWSAVTGIFALGFSYGDGGYVVDDFAYCLEFTKEGILENQQLIGGRLNVFKETTKQQVEEWMDEYTHTIKVFKEAGASGAFFDKSYGYAVFPNIGKGGITIGGAYGKGRVYEQGKYVGDTSMTQVSIGFQMGYQTYSQIVFFEDNRAFDDFTSGNYEFGAEASAVALTSGSSAHATTTGSSAGTSSGQHDATTKGSKFNNGMAIFTVAKGGLMYEASVSGQKFSYTTK